MARPPSIEHGPAGSSPFGCTANSDGSICDAVAGISKVVRDPILTGNHANVLPPPETPGAVDPAITQSNIDDTICDRATPGRHDPPTRSPGRSNAA